jgi:biopolymer transport protein ExbD
VKIHARPSRRRAERITLNLASMIDVTFLLLIYFMLTTVLVRPEDRLTSAIQTESEGAMAASDLEPQIIDVLMHDGSPVYQYGERLLQDRAALTAAMSQMVISEGIIIRVSDAVPVGFAVAAMQVANDTGFEQVTYVPQQ